FIPASMNGNQGTAPYFTQLNAANSPENRFGPRVYQRLWNVNAPGKKFVNSVLTHVNVATDANKRVNLSTGTGVSTETAAYQIFQIDMNGQTVNNGVYTGNDLSGQGVIKVDNSQLAGAFMIPVANVQFTLGLYDTDGNVVKTWSVLDGTTNVFSLQANHFYSLGIKKSTGSTDGSTPENPGQPGDEDSPIDLLNDQNIVITVSPAWELIHNLTVQ
ncbi:MAG: hypothetical protein K2P62_09790, partial [Phocaeicola sp.]|nr:hypothetical protein [Phocaeicola sp.]